VLIDIPDLIVAYLVKDSLLMSTRFLIERSAS
jgi:hypothetical protein